jgi:hypothetical protein
MAGKKKAGKAAKRGSKGSKLSMLEDAFCTHYLLCKGNGAEAVRRAGYKASDHVAQAAQAYQLLQRPKIQARIQQLRENAADVVGINEVEVVQLLTNVIRLDPRKIGEWGPGYFKPNFSHDGVHEERDANGDAKEEFHEGLGADVANTIASISYKPGMFGVSMEIKTYDKLAAGAQLAKLMGWNATDREAIRHNAELRELKREQLELERERLAIEKAKGQKGGDPNAPMDALTKAIEKSAELLRQKRQAETEGQAEP